MQGRNRFTCLTLALAWGAGVASGLHAQEVSQDPDPEEREEALREEAPAVAFADPGRFVAEDGEQIYRSVCQACHMPEGQGAEGAGAYPALANNPQLEFPDYPVSVVVHGLRAMPPFGSYLDDEQVAAVVNFIRTNFGNEFIEEEATAEMVGQVR